MTTRFRRTLLLGLTFVACGRLPGPGEYDARDVRGNYALSYDDRLTLRLDVGGGVREVTQTGYGGVVDFGTVNGQPVTLDLAAFCARPDVQCPSEAFWAKVAVDQPNLEKNGLTLQTLHVVDDTVHALDAGVRAKALGGLVNHEADDAFLLGLGADGAANSNCLLLGLSLAGGRFTRVGERQETVMQHRTPSGRPCTPADAGVDGGAGDAGAADGGAGDAGAPEACTLTAVKKRVVPPQAKVAGIADGRVVVGWFGGCAFGPVLAGAVLSLETGFTGTRTGDFDPPPYTPAQVVLPDGGLDGGSTADAGP